MLKDDKETNASRRSAFTRVMRYWRTSQGISQSALSAILKTPTRHISFLETGRSQPTRSMLKRLQAVFKLSVRDAHILWFSAGFVPEEADDVPEKEVWEEVEGLLRLMLERQNPYPAVVINRRGDIRLWNDSFYEGFRGYVSEELLRPPLNIYRLYLCSGGLRDYVKDWEVIACRMLLALRQEYFLSGSPDVKALFDELCEIEEIPKDWSERAANLTFSLASYEVSFKTALPQGHLAYLAAVTAVMPASGERSSLLMHSYYPVSEVP